MITIPHIGKLEGSGAPAPETPAVEEPKESGGSDAFEKLLRSVLSPDQGNNVSEEELFAAMIQERITSLKGDEAGNKFKESMDKIKAELARPDGFIPMEKAALRALRQFRDSGELTKEEADQIYAESFSSAQLDDNKTALFDGRGGPNDPTMAVASMEAALLAARTVIEKFKDGSEAASAMSLDDAKPTGSAGGGAVGASASQGSIVDPSAAPGGTVTPKGTEVDGPEGFLFKPITNNQGTLAVLLAAQLTGHVASVVLKDAEGNLIEEGRLMPEGIQETGREKYSFNKKGGSYPKDIVVEVTLSDGTITNYSIPDPSQRYD